MCLCVLRLLDVLACWVCSVFASLAGCSGWLASGWLTFAGCSKSRGPGNKDPTAEWISEGLWLAWGPDEQSFDDSKAPCGGRPRSVWNPPHGPVPPRACSIQAFGVAKQERGLALATGGRGARTPKSDDLIEDSAPNPNFTSSPEGVQVGPEPSLRSVVRPALLQAKTPRVQDLIFRDVSANSPVFVAKERAVRRGIRN